jgi:hypothetical protein
MKKKFDCVEMKHRSAEKIQLKISGLSTKKELEFWQKHSEKLHRKKSQSVNNQFISA